MNMDPSSPPSLLHLQTWFGKTISSPLHQDQKLPFSEESSLWVKSGPVLTAHERVEIYHQQYWWRLLNTLHINFPFVTRLFGHEDFNHKIGIPYLTDCPPDHWALCRLGQSLPSWIRNAYHGEDRDLVFYAAEIDACAEKCAWTKGLAPVSSEENILDTRLGIQPYLFLFKLPLNLLEMRETFLEKEVDYWSCHPFPQAEYGEFYYVIYRSRNQTVAWKSLSLGEYSLLSSFIPGLTIKAACEKIEEEGGPAYEEATLSLSLWFHEWTRLGWLRTF